MDEIVYELSKHKSFIFIGLGLILVATVIGISTIEYKTAYNECLDDAEKYIDDDTKFNNAVLLCDKKYYPSRINE